MTRRWTLLRLTGLFAAALAAFARPDIVSLSSPLTETLYLLGAQARLAAVTDVCVFPEQVIAARRSGKVRELGSFMNPDMAAIEALHPSLILTSTSLQRGLAERLRAKGFHVLHFEPASLADILAQTEQIGSAIGKADAARRITRRMRGELDAIKSKSAALRKVRVYMEINHEGPWTIGTASPLNDLIEAAGGSNIFASDSGGAHIVTHEEILRRDPEVILSPIWLDAKLGGLDGIVTLASITARPGYSATTAVRSSRVLYYDSALLKHEGPRQIVAIKKLAYLLHPEVFPNPPGTIPWELGRVRP